MSEGEGRDLFHDSLFFVRAAGDDSTADLFYNLKKVFEKSNKMFYNEIVIIYNKVMKLYS